MRSPGRSPRLRWRRDRSAARPSRRSNVSVAKWKPRRSATCSIHEKSGQRRIVRRGSGSNTSTRSFVANSDIEQLSIDTIRTLPMDGVQQANAGHPGTAMALAPLAYLLYTEVMNHSPSNPQWQNRDRFVLSAGHACILQYSTLHLAGYNLSLDELKRFRQWQSITPGHPEHFLTPGIETTTGPLGQGFANSVGFGMAERFLADKFNRPHDEIVDHRVF